MAFMIPQYEEATRVDVWHDVTNESGESFIVHPDAPTLADAIDGDVCETEEITSGIFCRLSAPGYMDCTDWSGPHDTLETAQKDIADTFDVCAECGESLVDGDGEYPNCEANVCKVCAS